MPKDYHSQAYQHLTRLLESVAPGSPLPSARNLADELGVGYGSVHKAYARLASEERVTRVRKKGTFAGGSAAVTALWRARRQKPRLEAACSRFSELLERAITNDIVRVGDPLPTMDALAQKFQVSKSTVRTGLTRLVESGLLRRQGRRYLHAASAERFSAGRTFPARQDTSAISFLVISRKLFELFDFLADELRGPFYHGFFRELQGTGVALQRWYLPNEPGELRPQAAPLERLRRWLTRKGRRCAGIAFLEDLRGLPGYEKALTGLPVPLVRYLNESDYRAGVEAFPAMRGRGLLCATSEEELCMCLARGLAERGHGKVAFVSPIAASWVDLRFQALEKSLARFSGTRLQRFGPGHNVPAHWEQVIPFAREPVDPGPDAAGRPYLSGWYGGRESGAPAFLRESCGWKSEWKSIPRKGHLLIYLYALLGDLSRFPETTALIFPNDFLANYFEPLFAGAGLRIPRDFSLFSFDNHARYWANLSGSIDRGQEQLGAETARKLMSGDRIPSQSGRLLSRPYLVPRQGTGAARSGLLRLPKGWEVMRFED